MCVGGIELDAYIYILWRDIENSTREDVNVNVCWLEFGSEEGEEMVQGHYEEGRRKERRSFLEGSWIVVFQTSSVR